MNIPLTKPYWGKQEGTIINKALHTSTGAGDGLWSKKLVAIIRKLTGVRYVFPVTSCTHGLELAMMSLGIGSGDEVIVPSFTMTSTANAVILTGATPIFADVESKYYCIDPNDIEKKITKQTRGIIIVHYAGMACDMTAIKRVSKAHNLFIVEDAAHAIGATYRGKAIGRLGDIGVYSFHGTKNVSCGEGGVVLTDSKKIASRMEVYRANGTNRNAYLRGEVDKYSWVGPGSSYFLSDLLASIVVAQLSKLGGITKKRAVIANRYTNAFNAYQDIVTLPSVSDGTEPNWHIYALRFKTRESAQLFASAMCQKGIEVSFHYVPLHSSVMGKTMRPSGFSLPVTDIVSSTLVRLPIYPGLTPTELVYIISTAQKILDKLT